MTGLSVEEYVRDVGARLARFGPLALRPLAEIRAHLDESAAALVASGLSPEAAAREAISRFGEPEAIAFELTLALNEEPNPMERIWKIISITTMFTAVWGLAAAALLNPNGELLVATGLISVVTVAAALVCMKRDVEPGSIVVSGVALVAVGAAGVLWAVLGGRSALGAQIGVASLLGLYFVQGVLALWIGARRQQLEAVVAEG